jgi:hypothetical protein
MPFSSRGRARTFVWGGGGGGGGELKKKKKKKKIGGEN